MKVKLTKFWLKRTQKIVLVICVLICLGYISFEIVYIKDPRNLGLLFPHYDTRQLPDPSIRGVPNLQKLPNKLLQTPEYKAKFDVEIRETSPSNYFAVSNSEGVSSKHKKMKAVVIVASYRTGSSFIGQFFNQHSDVFYLFEPLLFSSWKRNSTHSVDQVLLDLLLCNFTSMQDEIRSAWAESVKTLRNHPSSLNAKNMREQKACLDQGLCFRGKTNAICTPEMCGNSTVTNCKLCQPPPPSLMQKACLDAKVRVLKVIRIQDLNVLKRSFEHPDIDLKVIHLVRDPRPTLLSRIRLRRNLKNLDIRNVITPTCKRNIDIHSRYLKNDPEWLKGKYKLTRYEDVIENPKEYARNMYKFINFPHFNVNDELLNWIEESTTHPDQQLFGTGRNTAIQKYRWRYKIPLPLVSMVQRECKEMMNVFGYKPITTRHQLLNIEESLLDNFYNT